MTPGKAVRIEITVSPQRASALDAARGHEARASFIKRALESALSEAQGVTRPTQAGPVPVPSAATDGVRPAASTRMPVAAKEQPRDLMEELRKSLEPPADSRAAKANVKPITKNAKAGKR